MPPNAPSTQYYTCGGNIKSHGQEDGFDIGFNTLHISCVRVYLVWDQFAPTNHVHLHLHGVLLKKNWAMHGLGLHSVDIPTCWYQKYPQIPPPGSTPARIARAGNSALQKRSPWSPGFSEAALCGVRWFLADFVRKRGARDAGRDVTVWWEQLEPRRPCEGLGFGPKSGW